MGIFLMFYFLQIHNNTSLLNLIFWHNNQSQIKIIYLNISKKVLIDFLWIAVPLIFLFHLWHPFFSFVLFPKSAQLILLHLFGILLWQRSSFLNNYIYQRRLHTSSEIFQLTFFFGFYYSNIDKIRFALNPFFPKYYFLKLIYYTKIALLLLNIGLYFLTILILYFLIFLCSLFSLLHLAF